MSKRVVFLCYHGLGHINPCLSLARILGQQGHIVTIATFAYFTRYVSRAGVAHYPLKSVPFGMGFESWVNAEREIHFRYWANLRDRFSDQLYHRREQELTSLVEDLKPDVIFIDGTQATDFIVLYPLLKRRRIAIALLHAMFPTHVLPGRPPVNSLTVPGDIRSEQLALTRMKQKQTWTDLKQRLLYGGMSDRFIIHRRLRRNQVSDRYKLALPSLFDFQVASVPAFILAPRQFDFPGFNNPSNHHYVGFIQNDATAPRDEKWNLIMSTIKDRRAAGSRLVYCSFGTVEAGNEKFIDSFTQHLCTAIAPQDMLVISLGKNRPTPKGLERDNVWALPMVPQTELLPFVDAFVTHGGLSSIKEAIEAEVPMLLIVAHHQFDPPGNAARVQFHGMGIIGDLHDESNDIRKHLNRLFNDARFRKHIQEIKKVNESLTPGAFLTQFDALTPDALP
jgi:UDP:flavonoid glycosyltransferase YjiC (YdhE family)